MLLSEIDLDKTYSYADYYKWTFDERVELINGKVYQMMPGPNRFHQELTGDIFNELKNFLKGRACKVYVAPFDVRLPKKGIDDKSIFTVVQPDVCVICDLEKIDRRGCIGAPDIVVEVLSPGNNSKEVRKKYDVYEEAGVKEYWMVSPQDQTVSIYILHDGQFQASRLLAPGDVAISSVLPGFSLDLTVLFRDINADEY